MAVTTGQIQSIASLYKGINGRIFYVTPGMFRISGDGGTTWETLTSVGTLTNCVNCTYLGGSPTAKQLMVDPGVTSISFKMDTDTSIPQEVYSFPLKDCLSLPNISTTRIKTAISETNNVLSSLSTSANINLCSPRISRSQIYVPSGINVNNLPELVGRPDKITPHAMGEWIGYCHTAEAGFKVIGWDNAYIPYNLFASNNVTTILATVIKNQIPVAGDMNLDKWARVRISYGSVVRDNLDFRNLAVDRYINEATPAGTYVLNVEYWNGSQFVLTNTKSLTITKQTIEGYIHDTLKTEFGFTITNANFNNKTVTFTRTVKNLGTVDGLMGDCYVMIAGSPSSKIHLDNVNVAAGATYTQTGLATIWDDINEADFQSGEYVHLNAYLTEGEEHYFMSSNSKAVS